MRIATANSKGGVGKTTLAVHLAGWMHLYEHKVILLDCDAQRLSSRWLGQSMPEIEAYATSDAEEITELIPKLYERCDVVVIDGPGGLGETTGAILAQADAVLIPTGASNLDIMGMDWTTDTIHQVQQLRDGPPQAVIIPVQVSSNRKSTRHLMHQARSQRFGITKAMLPRREIYRTVSGSQEHPPRLIWQLGRSVQVRTAVAEMDTLLSEIFPEVAEQDPNRIARELMTKKERLIAEQQHDDEIKSVANA